MPATGSSWFKTSELGKTDPSTNNWVQGNMNSGAPINMTIPDNLEPGPYVVKTDIVALQNAATVNLAEYYSSCMQIQVGGSQAGDAPTGTVIFPGAYKATDPGILVDVSFANIQYCGNYVPILNTLSSVDLH